MIEAISRIQFAPDRVTIYSDSGVYVILCDVRLARGFANAVASICEDARRAQRIIDEQNHQRQVAATLETEH